MCSPPPCEGVQEAGYRDAAALAAIRNNNSMMFEKLGPDTGYDASHDKELAEGLSAFLNNLSKSGEVPKTILYTLNPKDYYSSAR